MSIGYLQRKAAWEILSSADFAIILLKHFQFPGINIPGHDKERPAKTPKNRNKKYLIKITLILINNMNKKQRINFIEK